jgi:hypothetical protein
MRSYERDVSHATSGNDLNPFPALGANAFGFAFKLLGSEGG